MNSSIVLDLEVWFWAAIWSVYAIKSLLILVDTFCFSDIILTCCLLMCYIRL